VNGTNTVSSADALLVLHYTVGNIPSFPAGKWTFDKELFTIAGLALLTISLVCVLRCEWFFSPSSKAHPDSKPETRAAFYAEMMKSSKFPVYLSRGLELGAMTLILDYPADLLSILDISSEMEGFVYNNTEGRSELPGAIPGKEISARYSNPEF